MSEKLLTLHIRDASGNSIQDPLLLRVTDIRIVSQYPAGLFTSASFTLPRDILYRPSLLRAGFEVAILDGAHMAFHGWVDGLEHVGSAGQQGTRVNCVGDWTKYMQRRGIERRWADTDITTRMWARDTSVSGAELATDDRDERIRITPKAEAWASGELYAINYQTPTGESVGKITLNYDMQEGAQAWLLELYNGLGNEFSISTSSTGTQNVDLGTTTAQLQFEAAANQTPTADGTYYGEVSSLTVYATRDHASATLGTVNIYQIALDIVDRLAVDETLISANIAAVSSALTFSLVPFVTNGYEMYASILARAAAYGSASQEPIGYGLQPPNYAPDDKPRLFLETYPDLGDYDYETSIDESGFSARLNMDDVWNYIIVEYTDLDGNARTLTPEDSSNLTSAASVSAYGTREYVLRIGNASSTSATNFGRRFLSRHAYPTYAVTRPLRVSRIRGKNGGFIPASRIYAGKRLRVVDLPNITGQTGATGTAFLITRCEYDHNTGTATLSVGGAPDDLAILFARFREGYR